MTSNSLRTFSTELLSWLRELYNSLRSPAHVLDFQRGLIVVVIDPITFGALPYRLAYSLNNSLKYMAHDRKNAVFLSGPDGRICYPGTGCQSIWDTTRASEVCSKTKRNTFKTFDGLYENGF